jgi:quercetin dioxygenase-like cupin family protein
MKMTRLLTNANLQTYFQDEEIPLNQAEIGKLTESFIAESVHFGEIDNVLEIPWHNAPRRQFVIVLEGGMEVEISDGSKRFFKEGDIVLAEDLTGQGHITRATSNGKNRYLVIPLK